jgi:hypothetical protein
MWMPAATAIQVDAWEDSVPERIRLQAVNSGLRVAAFAGEHVMPLEQLVEHDSVHKAAQPDPQHDPGCSRTRPGFVWIA